ncbi:MAG: Dam family site-specific DNA-(adenine-N6)-methyltransferase, partial [Prevotellaceae bacterium]|nr:Dam family site-specific DNA-(adenine-N6)-methyltransferase [Prevotellaceae bacterium]
MKYRKNIGIKYLQTTRLGAKPFVKWVGGKGKLLSSIEKSLPKAVYDRSDITYVEPFVGGGAMLFWILENVPAVKKAVINDINPDLTNAYRTVKENVHELIALLKNIQNEYQSLNSEENRKEYYLKMRERYNTKSLDNIENTALFIFLNRTCFNGLYRVNSRGLFNVPFGKYTNPTICDENTLLADSELLQNVEILTGDFEQTLNYATENSLFYNDPPYKPLSQTSSFNSYAKEEFNDAEQIRLKRFCDKLNEKGSLWILSNSDVKSNDPDNNFFD